MKIIIIVQLVEFEIDPTLTWIVYAVTFCSVIIIRSLFIPFTRLWKIKGDIHNQGRGRINNELLCSYCLTSPLSFSLVTPFLAAWSHYNQQQRHDRPFTSSPMNDERGSIWGTLLSIFVEQFNKLITIQRYVRLTTAISATIIIIIVVRIDRLSIWTCDDERQSSRQRRNKFSIENFIRLLTQCKSTERNYSFELTNM